MDNYIVSARKYRPSTFESVVGQKTLTQTLKNAINAGKLAHAYLFCGPRGVGKTSCARIFAKTINCLNPTSTGEACNECESCKAFNQQRSYNIHELDAASNNSVEDIRELISQVQIPPQIGKYKVFIVDEVHMLSTAAFNAFLKTLEEPPHHAIFILATTEKHKILPTILSRCQIYDFNRITPQDMVAHLQYVAAQENITADAKALGVIAQKADGGMRDALSIFDQVVSFTAGNVTYQSVIDNLNVLDYEYYFRITEAFLKNDVPSALLILNEIISKGFDPQHFITGLSSHLRQLLVSRDPVTLPLIEAGPEIAKRYGEQAANCPVQFLYRAMEVSNECDLNYKASRNKRLLVEIALIRISQLTLPPVDAPLDGVKEKLQPIAEMQIPAPQVPTANVPTANVQPAAVSSPTAARHTAITPPPAAAMQSRPMGSPLKNISLKNGVQKTPSAQQTASTTIVTGNNAVTQEALNQAWIEFTKTIPTEVILINTMKASLPQLTSATEFEVVVENQDQVSRMNERGTDLLQFLKRRLQNASLMMHVRESDRHEQRKAYSAPEKYALMLKTNPDLARLKEIFNLEIS